MLYIVATPIGNLKDITLRAIETLKECDFIIAENPGNSQKLLNHYEIPKKPIKQFAEHNEQKVLSSLVSELKSKTGCLITDAGTPGIADPGFRLVRACVGAGITVVPIPGAAAAIAALSASGLPTDKYMFLSFIPKTEVKVVRSVELSRDNDCTIVFFESPFRIIKTLEIIAKHFPEAHLAVARELTKQFEEFIQGTATEIIPQVKPKGEFVVVLSFKK